MDLASQRDSVTKKYQNRRYGAGVLIQPPKGRSGAGKFASAVGGRYRENQYGNSGFRRREGVGLSQLLAAGLRIFDERLPSAGCRCSCSGSGGYRGRRHSGHEAKALDRIRGIKAECSLSCTSEQGADKDNHSGGETRHGLSICAR